MKGKVVWGPLLNTQSFASQAARLLLGSISFGNELQDYYSSQDHLENTLGDY